MKIKEAWFKNFAKVNEITVNFDKNITYLVGDNGSGKSTVGLNGIWFVFKGVALRGKDVLHGDRFRFIGPHGKKAEGRVVLSDESTGAEITITRKLLKSSTSVKIEASDGRQLGQEFLDDMFSTFLIDPVSFSRLSGKEQAEQFGIDTSEHDARIKDLKEERTVINREVKRLKGVAESLPTYPDAPKKEVSVQKLMVELQEAQDLNDANREQKDALGPMELGIDVNKNTLVGLSAEIVSMELKIMDMNRHKNSLEGTIDRLTIEYEKEKEKVDGLVYADEQITKDQIAAADSINAKVRANANSQDAQNDLRVTEDVSAAKKEEIAGAENARVEYLRTTKLPWNNITINENGEFRMNGKPFSAPYFSTGEILKLGARIGSKLKSGLKYVWFPSSQDLDDKNRAEVFEALIKDGFQIVAEFVGTEKKKDHTILLKEMVVVDSYEEAKDAGPEFA